MGPSRPVVRPLLLCIATAPAASASYMIYPRTNYYGGPPLDTIEVEAGPGTSAAGCERRCDAHPRCNCAVWRRADASCWGHSYCELSGLLADPGCDVLVKPAPASPRRPRYRCRRRTNVLSARGSAGGPAGQRGLNITECTRRCSLDPLCACAVVQHLTGRCWTHAECEPNQFTADTSSDVCVKNGGEIDVGPATTQKATARPTTTTRGVTSDELAALMDQIVKFSPTTLAKTTTLAASKTATTMVGTTTTAGTATQTTTWTATNDTGTTVATTRPTTAAARSTTGAPFRSTSAAPGGREAAPAEGVLTKMTVDNVDFNKLRPDPALCHKLKHAIREAVSETCNEAMPQGGAVAPEAVVVALSAGSVVASAWVVPPSGISADSLASTLRTSGARLAARAARKARHAVGSSEVCTGNIGVSGVSVGVEQARTPAPGLKLPIIGRPRRGVLIAALAYVVSGVVLGAAVYGLCCAWLMHFVRWAGVRPAAGDGRGKQDGNKQDGKEPARAGSWERGKLEPGSTGARNVWRFGRIVDGERPYTAMLDGSYDYELAGRPPGQRSLNLTVANEEENTWRMPPPKAREEPPGDDAGLGPASQGRQLPARARQLGGSSGLEGAGWPPHDLLPASDSGPASGRDDGWRAGQRLILSS